MTIPDKLNAVLPRGRRDERGAALITALLTAILLFGVGGVLIVTSSMSSVTAVDSTAETQALYAAEAGLQEALRIMRGNMPDNGNTNTIEVLDKVNFKEAATASESNKTGDTSTTAGIARLSNWLNYSYLNNTANERVPLTGGGSYSPLRDMAYSVEVIAPDSPVAGVAALPGGSTIENPVFNKDLYTVLDPGTAGYYGGRNPITTWHPHHCGHCSWDYRHCGMYNAANPALSGTPGMNPTGCTHSHCKPTNWGAISGTPGEDGYQRVILKVTGYGPKGAKKVIEMLVKKEMFEYETPAMMFVASAPSTVLTFDLSGSGTTSTFDGHDGVAVGFVTAADYDYAADEDTDGKGPDRATGQFEVYKARIELKGGNPEHLGESEIPELFSSADRAREVRANLMQLAAARGRYFTTASPPASTNIGTTAAPQLTFINGNYTLTGNGVGLLVVTGKLTLGTFTYQGLVMVMGDSALTDGGYVNVTAHASDKNQSKLTGGLALAKFGSTGDFQAPIFRITSGMWKLDYNRPQIEIALNTIGTVVVGARER